MGIRSIVFDFDGTLIDSNRLKYDAYFELFPDKDRHARIIRDVLSESFEQTRYVILEEILRRLGVGDHTYMKREVSKLAERYNDIVVAGAKTCPEKAGAEEALKKFAPMYRLYVNSTTPDASLKEIIRFRKWDGYFRGVFGYPHEKARDSPAYHGVRKAEKRSGACGRRWGIRQEISSEKWMSVRSCYGRVFFSSRLIRYL